MSASLLPARRGFTLVEIMVAVAVMALLISFVAQATGIANAVANRSRKLMDADGEARVVFDRIGKDLKGMLKRTDVDYCFVSRQGGNDALYFYSEAPGLASSSDGSSQSSLSLVGYKVVESADTSVGAPAYRLERLGKGLQWSASGASSAVPVFLVWTNSPLSYFSSALSSGNSLLASVISSVPVAGTFTTSWSSTNSVSTSSSSAAWGSDIGDSITSVEDGNYQVLGAQTFRLKIAFLQQDGTWSSNPNKAPDRVTHTLTNVTAISVSIALLDEASRKMVTGGQMALFAAALEKADPSDAQLGASPPVLPAVAWQQAANKSGLAESANVPAAAAAQIRIYERTFYLRGPAAL